MFIEIRRSTNFRLIRFSFDSLVTLLLIVTVFVISRKTKQGQQKFRFNFKEKILFFYEIFILALNFLILRLIHFRVLSFRFDQLRVYHRWLIVL